METVYRVHRRVQGEDGWNLVLRKEPPADSPPEAELEAGDLQVRAQDAAVGERFVLGRRVAVGLRLLD
jgi:hypothetical protein